MPYAWCDKAQPSPAYYLDQHQWVPYATGIGPTGDTSLTLAVFNGSDVFPFGGQPLTVTFDNFHVFADQIVCP